MSLAKVTALFRCDGCNKEFEVSLDPASGGNQTVHDHALDRLHDLDVGACEVGGHQLCPECTIFIHAKFAKEWEARELVYDEVCKALNERAGV